MNRPLARYLDTGARPGAWNMAVDEVLLAACRKGSGTSGDFPLTFRVYGWSPPALSLGRGQSAERDVRRARLAEEGVDLCRRPTGGRAVLHDRELTYSLVGPAGRLGQGIEESYQRVSQGLAAGLRRLGAQVTLTPPAGRLYASQASCFATASVYELSVNGRKVVGSAQCRRGGAVLQHGCVLLHSSEERLARLLRPRDGVSRDGVGSADHAIGLCEAFGREVGFHEVADAVRAGLEGVLSVEFREEPLTDSELEEAETLVKTRYGTNSWTLSR